MASARYILALMAAAASYTHHVMVAANRTSYLEPQIISKPFHAAGRTPGTATFTILPDPDPTRYGVPLLGYSNPNSTFGFPTAHGTISSPNSLGYSSYYGWIQIIAFSNSTLAAGDANWSIDLLPAVAALDNPFVWYGSEASLFDGPFNLLVKELDWSARSFLAYMPNPALSRTVVPLLGFEWGYRLTNGAPIVKELKSLDLNVWNGHLGLFRSNFTNWVFAQV